MMRVLVTVAVEHVDRPGYNHKRQKIFHGVKPACNDRIFGAHSPARHAKHERARDGAYERGQRVFLPVEPQHAGSQRDQGDGKERHCAEQRYGGPYFFAFLDLFFLPQYVAPRNADEPVQFPDKRLAAVVAYAVDKERADCRGDGSRYCYDEEYLDSRVPQSKTGLDQYEACAHDDERGRYWHQHLFKDNYKENAVRPVCVNERDAPHNKSGKNFREHDMNWKEDLNLAYFFSRISCLIPARKSSNSTPN